MKLAFVFLFTSTVVLSQTITELKIRYSNYLNFKGSLNSAVVFTDRAVSIINNGKPEFTLYENELMYFENIIQKLPIKKCVEIYNWKKNKELSIQQYDSLFTFEIKNKRIPIITSGLKNRRIAIDAGHFAGNVTDARVEQKFICFAPTPLNKLKDTIQFNEGFLTLATAQILKQQLEEKGAIVFVTREQQNYTAFNTTYQNWFDTKRKKVLDSLLLIKNIDLKKHNTLLNLTKEKLFWEFFRDYELAERAKLINAFKPDATVIIHYNVDEKNTDWINPTSKNFTMTFIGGGMTSDNLKKETTKIHFLRLLISRQLNQSEILAALTVNEFNKQLNIPIAKNTDADYLKDNCLTTASKGVYCRNLALCRTINSPLVYGESLYQDNEKECVLLQKNDTEIYNLKVPNRVVQVANCYFKALSNFFVF